MLADELMNRHRFKNLLKSQGQTRPIEFKPVTGSGPDYHKRNP